MQLLLLPGALLPQVELKQTPKRDHAKEKGGVHLLALYPSCQRVTEDVRPSSHSTLLPSQGITSPLSLYPPFVSCSTAFVKSHLHKLRFSGDENVTNKAKKNLFELVQNTPAAFQKGKAPSMWYKPLVNEESVIFLSWSWVMITVWRTNFFVNIKLFSTVKCLPSDTLSQAE